jgi:predicted SnoaL-like aldol condensation-catalyzing enzyme
MSQMVASTALGPDSVAGKLAEDRSIKFGKERAMIKSEERGVQIVLKALDTLFNKRDYATAERFWSPSYIQHSAHIPPGRDGLFNLIKTLPDTLHYENHVAAASGDFVILHGRFSGLGLPAAWVVGDIVRMEDGMLAEHWDVIQDEATREQSRSGLPMFGDKFPA